MEDNFNLVSFLVIKKANLNDFERIIAKLIEERDITTLVSILKTELDWLQAFTPPANIQQWTDPESSESVNTRIEIIQSYLADFENNVFDFDEAISHVALYFYSFCEFEARKLFFMKPSLHIAKPIHKALRTSSSIYRDITATFHEINPEIGDDLLSTCDGVNNSEYEGFYQMYNITKYAKSLHDSLLLLKSSLIGISDEVSLNLETFLLMLRTSLKEEYILLAVRPVFY